MTTEAFIAIAIILLTVGLLALTRLATDAVMMGALTLMMVVPVPASGGWKIGILDTQRALAGFGNTGLATVAVLFIVVAGLRATGAVDWIASGLLGRPQGLRRAMLRIIAPVGVCSTILNNTPVVAMLIPAINDWSRRVNIPASKLLIPLSYAAILGGMCSLIGTSTNLVVSGLVAGNTTMSALPIFEIAWLGVPCAVVGGVYLLVLGPVLLPDRTSTQQTLADAREFTAEMMVPDASPLDGRTVYEAGLRDLPGCYLVEIERGGDIIPAVGPNQVLRAGDRLVFAGVVDSIRDLQKQRGLIPATDQIFKLDSHRHNRTLYEAVVSSRCRAVGKSIKESKFRTVFGAAVLAVARSGERVQGRIGDIELEPGDVLLLEAGASFLRHHGDSVDFLLVRALEDSAPRRHERAAIALTVLLAMVVAAAVGWLSMLHAGLLAAGAMIVLRCCSVTDARRNVDWSVLVVIGAALGLGAGLDQSGAAKWLANSILQVAGDNPWLALAAIYVVTSLMTEVITNNAAVALTFPIALATAQRLDVNFTPFIYAIMIAGSGSFATPLGYQTNLMVFGPGGYRFKDFLRVGLPLNILLAVTAILLAPRIWQF